MWFFLFLFTIESLKKTWMFPVFCKNCGGKQHALRYRLSPWAQVFGNLAALLTLLFWRSKTEVFVDRACIHQGFLEKKWRGTFLGEQRMQTPTCWVSIARVLGSLPHMPLPMTSPTDTRSTFPKTVGILKHGSLVFEKIMFKTLFLLTSHPLPWEKQTLYNSLYTLTWPKRPPAAKSPSVKQTSVFWMKEMRSWRMRAFSTLVLSSRNLSDWLSFGIRLMLRELGCLVVHLWSQHLFLSWGGNLNMCLAGTWITQFDVFFILVCVGKHTPMLIYLFIYIYISTGFSVSFLEAEKNYWDIDAAKMLFIAHLLWRCLMKTNHSPHTSIYAPCN